MFNPLLHYSDNKTYVTLDVVNGLNAGVNFSGSSSRGYRVIDWGDGKVEKFLDNSTKRHTYFSNYTGKIKVYFLGTSINYFTNFSNVSGNVEIDLNEISKIKNLVTFNTNISDTSSKGKGTYIFPSTLKNFSYITQGGAVNESFFNIENLNEGLETFVLYQLQPSNRVTGDIAFLPTTLVRFQPYGNAAISGDIAAFKPAMKSIQIGAGNTVTGNIESLNSNNINSISVSGNNSIYGNIYNLNNNTNLLSIGITGNNSITGNIPSLSNCTTFNIAGMNSISGDLSNTSKLPKASTIIIAGINTVSNTIESSDNITTLQIFGENTISSIQNLPNCTTFSLQGKNTVTGNPFQYLPKATTITITGFNKVNDYSSRTYPNNMVNFTLMGNASLNQEMVNILLSNLSDANWDAGASVRTVIIKGNCAVPSSLGQSKIAVLREKNVVVQTN